MFHKYNHTEQVCVRLAEIDDKIHDLFFGKGKDRDFVYYCGFINKGSF